MLDFSRFQGDFMTFFSFRLAKRDLIFPVSSGIFPSSCQFGRISIDDDIAKRQRRRAEAGEKRDHQGGQQPCVRTIAEGLLDESTGALASDDTQLTKFHGIYQQDDRDIRRERRKAKLEPAYSFMTRVRLPGGACTRNSGWTWTRFAPTTPTARSS